MVTVAPLRIVYFGTPEFAVPTLLALLASRHPVVAVVSQPDRPKGRGHHLRPAPTKQVAETHGLTILQPVKLKDDAFLHAIEALQPDLGVVAAYGRILPDALLGIPRFGLINVHASLLPAYRGAAPVHRAVIAGEHETGVSIMRIVRELDAGPVFATTRMLIDEDATSPDVERRLAELGAQLLVDVVEHIAAGRSVEVPQDHARATHAPKIAREEGAIDWSLPAERIHNLVRGLQPWPMVSIWLDGARQLLHRTRVSTERANAPPGTVVAASHGRLAIASGGQGVVDVLSIQPEGRRAMTAAEFLAGHRVEQGVRVTSP
jgi:methionyl-tRNA formyltransferase